MTEIEDQLLSEIKELLGDGLARNYHTLSVVYRMESALQANNNNNNNNNSPDCKMVTNGINGDSNGIDPQTGFPIKKRRIKNLGPPVRPQCSECGKDFSNRSALSKHKLIHSDERKFVCNICAKAFKRQDHLNGHMLTHRDKKPFECDVEGCEKTYCDARSLRRHKENHHANNVQVSVLQGGNWSQELNQLLSAGAGPGNNNNNGTTNGSSNAATNNNGLMTVNVSKIYPHSPHHHYNNYNNTTTTTTTTTSSSTTTTTTTTNSITTSNHHHPNYQIHSHSVPNTPTNLNPLLSPAVPHQISTHANHFNQSLPCTPTQTNSFSFSPHQVQQYHQQQASLPSTPTDNQMQLSFPAQPNSVSYSSPSYNNMTPNNPSNVAVFNYPPPSELPPTTPTTPITPIMPSNGQQQQQGQPSLQPIYEEMNYETNEETSVIVNGHDVNFVNFEVESLIDQISTDHEQEHHDQHHHHHHQQQQPQHKKQKNTQNSANYTQQVTSSHLDATQQQQQSSDHSDQLVLSSISKSQNFFPNDDLDAQSLDGPSVNYNLIDHHNQRTHHLNQQHQQHLLSHLSSNHHPHHSQHTQQHHHQQQVQQQLQHQQHQQPHHSQQTAAIQFNRHHHHHHHHHHNQQQTHQLHNHHLHQPPQHSQHSQQHQHHLHHQHQPQQQHQHQHPPHPLPSITITNTSSPPSTKNEGPIHRGRSGKGLNVHRGKSESFVETHYVQSNLFKEERKDKETLPDTISRISSCINSTTTSNTVIESTSVFNSSTGTTSNKVDENELMESTSCSLVTSTSNHNPNNYNTNNNHSNINTNNSELIHISNANSSTTNLPFSSNLPTPRSTLRSSSSNLVINLSPEETKDIDEDDDDDDDDEIDDDDTFSGNNGKDEHIGVSYDEDDDDDDEEDDDDDVFINPAIISPVTSPKSNNQSISSNHLKDNNYKSINSSNNSSNNLTITSNSQSVNCSPLHTSVITNKNSVIKVTPVNERSSPKRPKHKPEPLYIPPHVNAFGQYASRLRSPRLWDPTGLHSLPSHDVNKSSPPPYTPPPMLSPLRKGSGLYWAIISSGNATPKSATLGTYINTRKSLSQPTPVVEPSLSVVNSQLNDSSANINASTTSDTTSLTSTSHHHNANNTTTINSTPTIIHNNVNSTNNNVNVIINSNVFKEIYPKSSELIISSTPTTAYEPDSPYNLDLLPSESDIQPHVNIGSSYQASIPAYIGDNIDVSKRYRRERADLVWNPIVLDKLPQSEGLDYYLELACSSCVPGAGRNIEFALHLLNICNGDLEEAISKLLSTDPIKLASNHPLIDYQYPESDVWTQDEINLYYQALIKFDKDFNAIAQKVETKTVKECIQFYYLWKKICPEEYKRLRIVRRRKEQEGLFYSNPVVTKEEETEDNDVDNKSAVDGDDDALSIDSPMNASPSSVSSTATSGTPVGGGGGGGKSKDKSGLFPCRVCGKVFSKVKSRSAHMKVHGAGAAANPAYSSASK